MNLVPGSPRAARSRSSYDSPSSLMHDVWLTDVHLARLDLITNIGIEHDVLRGRTRTLTSSEARLLLLDWTRDRIPLPTPSALWALEAAALTMGSTCRWRRWTADLLPPAFDALLASRLCQGELEHLLHAAARRRTGVLLSSSAELLTSLISAITRLAPRHPEGPVVDLMSATEPIVGCEEVEWDRVDGKVALDEHGLRSRVFGTVWIASIAQQRHHTRNIPHDPMWARLVSDRTGRVHDQVQMRCNAGLYTARGFVPSLARGDHTRVDVTSDPDAPARNPQDRVQALKEQRLFRSLFFARLATDLSGWARFAEAYGAAVGLHVASPPSALRSGRFLAERHIRAEDVASVFRPLVSPAPSPTTPPLA